ncbi:MAG TPA: metal-dependent hydrolase [Pyrinomonadaceae bacterium]|nr:metal-dependent hydrolase [Pyrinomonadaceae bacterium]
MPLPIAHGLLGATLSVLFQPQSGRNCFRALLIGAAVANAADLDFLLVFVLGSKAWHRGFSHSIVFAIGLGLALLLVSGWRNIRQVTAYTGAFMSHGLLDFVTAKIGGGVELFWPWSPKRYKLGLVGLSEVPSQLPATGIVKTLVLELVLFVWPLIFAILFSRRKRQNAL